MGTKTDGYENDCKRRAKAAEKEQELDKAKAKKQIKKQRKVAIDGDQKLIQS